MPTKPNQATESAASAEIQRYWAALGEFVGCFSLVENIILATLWKLSGLSEPEAQALLSEPGVDRCLILIKRLGEVKKFEPNQIDHLNQVYTKLPPINTARNKLLHNGAQGRDVNDLTSSNFMKAYKQEKITGIRISPAILNQMTNDLHRILAHLLHVNTALPEEMLEWTTAADLSRPWLFKLEKI